MIHSLFELYRRFGKECWHLFLSAVAALVAVGLVFVLLRDQLLELALGILAPQAWIDSLRMTHEALFRELGGVLLFQVVTATCFSAISLLFFRRKERLSRRMEAVLTGSVTAQELPLRQELWLEAGLILVTANLLSVIYLAVCFSQTALHGLLSLCAYVGVALLFAMDVQSPVFFRRGLDYACLLRQCCRRPAATLAIAALLCGPLLLTEALLDGALESFAASGGLALRLLALILVNSAAYALAVPIGTLAALQALARPAAAPCPEASPLRWFRRSQLALAGLLLLFYLTVFGAMLRKVPLKSATYDVHLLSLGVEELFGAGPTRLRLDVTIHNTHDFLSLEVENASLLFNHDGKYLGRVGLEVPAVAPRTSQTRTLELTLDASLEETLGIGLRALADRLLRRGGPWHAKLAARMDVEVIFGITLPIYLTGRPEVPFVTSPQAGGPASR